MEMSEDSDCPVTVRKPLKIIMPLSMKPAQLVKAHNLFREDILYESTRDNVLKLDFPCKIVNKLNLVTKYSTTVSFEGDHVEKTSENVTCLIGQRNYDTVLSALLSVLSNELKIRSIYALLTPPKKTKTVSCQTDNKPFETSTFEEKDCQTDESSIMVFIKERPVKRAKRRKVTPYVVTEAPKKKDSKKIVIHPGPFYDLGTLSPQSEKSLSSLEAGESSENMNQSLPLLDFDENSNDSKVSTLTVGSIPGLLKDPLALIEKDIDKNTAAENNAPPALDWSNKTVINLLDGTEIQIPFKVEDDFHLATPEVMKVIKPEHRAKLLCYQMFIDWKNCLTPDLDNHLPLHVAAINGDTDLLRRQCAILKSKQESVDIATDEHMTPLQISIFRNHPKCTAMLLYFGADPLTTDEEYRTCFHLAAEADAGHLKALVEYCTNNPMKILQESEELWKPELALKPKEYLAKYLMNKIAVMFDNQGYTPLMVASKLGKHENVKILAEASPENINLQMPNSGNTALYLAVGSACWNANNLAKKSTVSEDFKKTIELLVELGADPATENHSGSTVNTVLTDLHVGELSMIIANKMTSKNCCDLEPNNTKVCVLLKDEDGNVKYENLTNPKKPIKKEKTVKDLKEKPVILQNVKIEEDQKDKFTKELQDKLVVLHNIQIERDQKEKTTKDFKEKPVILQNIKIEKDDPIVRQLQINASSSVFDVKKEEKLSHVSKNRENNKRKESPTNTVQNKTIIKDDYMDTFKAFVKDVSYSKIISPVPITFACDLPNSTKNENDTTKVNPESLNLNSVPLIKNTVSSNTTTVPLSTNTVTSSLNGVPLKKETVCSNMNTVSLKTKDPTNIASTSRAIMITKLKAKKINGNETVNSTNGIDIKHQSNPKFISLVSRKRTVKMAQSDKLNSDSNEEIKKPSKKKPIQHTIPHSPQYIECHSD